ncbi:MAG TPA: hypothetical protein DDZ53_12880, partial [Firmicutes bacterium]|nr:hypothetical protein [Bacillota bacterium]
LFGNEGYLMFSLPVSATQLLVSKVITTLIWFNLMLGTAAGLIVLLLREEVPVLMVLRKLFTWGAIRQTLNVLLTININVLPIIMAIFLGISLATVAVRNKKIGHFWGQAATAAGIALYIWSSILFAGWTYLDIALADQTLVSVTVAASQWINIAISVIFCTLFFSLTAYIMRQRLNLA